MEKIHIRFMKELFNIEFGELFDAISNRVEADKIDIPLLSTAFERLKPHSKELLKMNNKKMTHPLTQLILEQVNTRSEYLAGLRLIVDAKMFWHKSEERIAAARLLLWLDTYKNDIYAPTIHSQSSLVKDLMEDRKQSLEIQQATALLNLDELLEAIVKLTAKINRNYLKRLNERDTYVVNGKAIRDAAYDELKVLITLLDASYHSDVDVMKKEQIVQLSQNINEELKDYRTLLRSRNTKRKNRKDVKVAVKDAISEPIEEKQQEGEKENLPMGGI